MPGKHPGQNASDFKRLCNGFLRCFVNGEVAGVLRCSADAQDVAPGYREPHGKFGIWHGAAADDEMVDANCVAVS